MQRWAYSPGPPLTPWPADAAQFSASGISDPASLPEHSPAPTFVPSLKSRLRWLRSSPEDGGLSPPPWTLFLHTHHPLSHWLCQQPHPINSHGASSSAVPGAPDKAAHPTPLLLNLNAGLFRVSLSHSIGLISPGGRLEAAMLVSSWLRLRVWLVGT